MDSNTREKIGEKHISVLLGELVGSIEIFKNKKNIVVDCTLGMGGHAKKIIEKLNPNDIFIGFDADLKNLELAKTRLDNIGENVEKIYINSNFVNIKSQLEKHNINSVTAVYYDLGISSLHIDEPERGFSFKLDGPLDMRFDKSKGKTAADIVNSYNASELRRIFLKYGEERSSARIADKIVEKRKIKRFETTLELTNLISEVSKIEKTKNRIFQALRIETNKELENIEVSVNDAINLLEKNGIIFVISFHSLEDRIVKQIFKRETRDCICSDLICSCKHKKSLKILTKKPILPSEKEIKENSRSRSAKARVAKKII